MTLITSHLVTTDHQKYSVCGGAGDIFTATLDHLVVSCVYVGGGRHPMALDRVPGWAGLCWGNYGDKSSVFRSKFEMFFFQFPC